MECGVLRSFKNIALHAFEFYANGVVIAIVPASVSGNAGMPGAVIAAYELPEAAVAPDIEMA